MTRNLAAKLSFLTILALATVLMVGCKTTKPIDWNSRVGTYTFDQAVTELGPPDKQATLSDGKRAEITSGRRRPASAGRSWQCRR